MICFYACFSTIASPTSDAPIPQGAAVIHSLMLKNPVRQLLLALLALTLTLQAHANSNLAAIENFCLYVNVVSDDLSISGRSDELRQHLLQLSTSLELPVDDCIMGYTLQAPSIDISIITIDTGFAVNLRIMIDGDVILDGYLLTRIVIYSNLMVSAGVPTSYEGVRDVTQELFEDLAIDWWNSADS
jgi:hypothetical protein